MRRKDNCKKKAATTIIHTIPTVQPHLATKQGTPETPTIAFLPSPTTKATVTTIKTALYTAVATTTTIKVGVAIVATTTTTAA